VREVCCQLRARAVGECGYRDSVARKQFEAITGLRIAEDVYVLTRSHLVSFSLVVSNMQYA
jgi:hypothetical protein